MYQDFYLQFADENEANQVLYEMYPKKLDEALNVVETYDAPHYQNIDVLGVLHQKMPVDDPADSAPVAVPGWHVNVRVMPGEDAAALEKFKVNPEPKAWRRVWG